MIPVANPLASFKAHENAIMEAIHNVLSSGRYIQGEQCRLFEKEFAAWNEAGYSVGVGNGTQAIEIALRALGIGPGDEVITVSHTAVATVAAIELTGATPVLVDVEPTTLTLDPDRLDAATSAKTKAVIAVHLYGNPCDLTALSDFCKKKGIALIEDCAQAHGALYNGKKVGRWGALACFSFYPTKNLGTFGDGGAITTNDVQLAQKCCEIREYGWRQRYISEIPGLNSRLDELHAAVLRVKLAHLEHGNRRRQVIAETYLSADIAAFSPVIARTGSAGVFHLFVLRVPARESLIAQFQSKGIQTGIHYPIPIHLQPAYRDRVRVVGTMQHTERAADMVLSLPLFPELTETQVSDVVTTLNELGKGALHAA